MAKKTTPKSKEVAPTKKKSTKKKIVHSQPSKNAVAEVQPFFEFRITQQTLYWAILGVVSIAFAVWLYTLDSRVRDLYDQVDASAYNSEIQVNKPVQKTTEE